jgi:hypothetical protein
MEVPQMVRMELSELIQAAVMAEPAAVMVRTADCGGGGIQVDVCRWYNVASKQVNV